MTSGPSTDRPATTDEVVQVVSAALGPCRVLVDHSWPHGESRVVELETESGRRVVGKSYRQEIKYLIEADAYRRWVPALGQGAAELLACDDRAHVLVLSWIDARPVADVEGADLVDVHRQAGRLLARLHAAEPPIVMDDFVGALRRRLDEWVERDVDGVLEPAEVAFVADRLTDIAGLPDPVGVICHRDWSPRNWLVDDTGHVSVIDFESVRHAPWFEDLRRVWWNEWADDPELADAFFAGYGRRPTDDEVRSLEVVSSLEHITTIVWAHEHDDEPFGARARDLLAAARRRTT
ncbi:MAG: phosphotransferase enzyme family protein [Acidimicrobiales bacterium]